MALNLNKFLGLKDNPKKPEKKPEKIVKPVIEEIVNDKKKHTLKCTNKKCKYERITNKIQLDASDLVCKKCKSQMKEFTPKVKKSKSNEDENNNEDEDEN